MYDIFSYACNHCLNPFLRKKKKEKNCRGRDKILSHEEMRKGIVGRRHKKKFKKKDRHPMHTYGKRKLQKMGKSDVVSMWVVMVIGKAFQRSSHQKQKL